MKCIDDSPIKVGDTVVCIDYECEILNYDTYGGYGYEVGLEFVVQDVDVTELRLSTVPILSEVYGEFIYWGGNDGNGVFSNFVKKINRGKFKLKRK